MMKRNSIVNFLVLIANFTVSCDGETKFQLEMVKRVSFASGLPLVKLNPYEQLHLCTAARDSALVNGMEGNRSLYVFDHEIEFLDGHKEIYNVLRCPTVPVIFLRRGDAPDEIRILLQENKFMDEVYTFRLEIVKFVSQLEDATTSTSNTTLLLQYDLDSEDAYNICLAAKERFQFPHTLKMHEEWRVAQIYSFYEFVYHDGQTLKDTAIKCSNSHETYYVRLGKTANEFTVMLILESVPLRESLATLNPREQLQMCMNAQEFAVMDGMEPNSFYYLFDHEIVFLDGRVEIHTALRCPTTPVIFLRRGNTPDEIKIMLEKNKYTSRRYTFHADIVKSVSKCEEATYSGTSKPSLLFSHTDHDDAYRMCLAAKQRIPYTVKMCDSQDHALAYVFFEFVYHNGRKIRDMAIQCPTIPETYLREGETENEFIVMVVFGGV